MVFLKHVDTLRCKGFQECLNISEAIKYTNICIVATRKRTNGMSSLPPHNNMVVFHAQFNEKISKIIDNLKSIKW